MLHAFRVLVPLLLIAACSSEPADLSGPVRTEIVRIETGYALLRDGEPYEVRGAGMVIDDIARFAEYGGNSLRNWSTKEGDRALRSLLDSAHEHGVTVALGLPMQAERHGFDYDDEAAVARQLAAMRKVVFDYRDHPALLLWIIGNELNHSYTNPGVYDAVEDVARMIEELDPNHPTTTAVTGFHADVVAEIQARAPSLDFISFQVYGSLFGLPEKIAAAEFDGPFMVTEWGTIGWWEMEKTAWGAPVELTSSEKADKIRAGYEQVLRSFGDRLLGSYVFFWGQKQERTPTWFGLLTEDGRLTEAVDVMRYVWTGQWPENRAPQVSSITLAGRGARDSVTIQAGARYPVTFAVSDPDGDPLSYRWEVKPESTAEEVGGDFEPPIASLDGVVSDPAAASTFVRVTTPGPYRLYAYADDDHGHTAHANIPFLVAPAPQAAEALIAGEVMAVAYSGFRAGQHPDRGDGAVNPSRAEVLEDLAILLAHDFRLIRMYDAGENTRTTLELIREHDLPVKVLLGIWLRAEFSNHEGCPWLDEPIPDEVLAANRVRNAMEIRRGIGLAREFSDIVVAVNVGNEALVAWNDHMVPLERVIAYVREVRAAVNQPVTVADNYEWWIESGAALAAEVDFLGIHTYPVWEDRGIEAALGYTLENVAGVRAAHPDKPIAILEAGWATTATEFGERAGEAYQARYFRDLRDWARASNTTVFFFEAFDEPWKGDENDPFGAEKHWGLFFVDRSPKALARELDQAE